MKQIDNVGINHVFIPVAGRDVGVDRHLKSSRFGWNASG